MVSRLGNFSKSLGSSFMNRDFVLIGAGLSSVPDISKETLIVAEEHKTSVTERPSSSGL